MNQSKRIELASGQFLVHILSSDGRAPWHLKCLRLFPTTKRHIQPLVRECSAHAVKHLFGNQIANSTFHYTPGGRCAQVNELPGGEELLQLWLNFGVKIL